MENLYSLYDALVSINVPNDKARAVVDAMEEDLVTTLATKADLQLLGQDVKSQIELLRQDTKAEIELLRRDTKSEFHLLRQEVRSDSQLLRRELLGVNADLKAELKAEFKADIAELRQDIVRIRNETALLSSHLTVRLGSMLVVAIGVLFAALKLT